MRAKMTAADAANFLGVSLQAIHKALRARELPFEKSQNRVFFDHETARGLFRFDLQPRTLAFQIVKGGTGKTALALAIAARAHLYGLRVLCLDLDAQGNFTELLGVDAESQRCMFDILDEDLPLSSGIVTVEKGFDLVPSRLENSNLDAWFMLKNRKPLERVYADLLDPVRANYDLVVIDCPPALGNSVAAAALTSTMVVAPVVPDKVSISGLKLTTGEFETLEKNYRRPIPVRIVMNKFDSRNALSHDILAGLIRHPTYGAKLIKVYVRAAQEFPNAQARGESIFNAIKATTAKEDVDLLTVELLELQAQRKAQVDRVARVIEDVSASAAL